MLDRDTIKRMLLSLVIMGITSVIALVILSILTFQLKWQAPQVQVGITLTYIISGFLGGFLPNVMGKSRMKKKGVGDTETSVKIVLVKGITQGTIYIAVLLSISILLSANEGWDMVQIFLIWILLSVSSSLGIFTGEKGLWGRERKC